MKVKIAALQHRCTDNIDENLDVVERLIRSAAQQGAQIILPQEMFAYPFFGNMNCRPDYFDWAHPISTNPILDRMRALARDLHVVIPANVFERAGQAYFNTNVVIDVDGSDAGIYRKMHIPMGGPSCYEKYYFSPGDTGFEPIDTAFGRLGCAICWDQWFPETARIMTLKGADILFYPTAIGSDCHDHWETAMRGHSASNIIPVVAANRIGTETYDAHQTEYWGGSFITDHRGAILAKAGDRETVIIAETDLAENRRARADWAMFRDRRTDAYAPLLSLTGDAV
jgi:N-carbamoylputrescine amidase